MIEAREEALRECEAQAEIARKDHQLLLYSMANHSSLMEIQERITEVESSLVGHDAVAEAAVVGFPHQVKGEAIYAYVILKEGREGEGMEDVREEHDDDDDDEEEAVAVAAAAAMETTRRKRRVRGERGTEGGFRRCV